MPESGQTTTHPRIQADQDRVSIRTWNEDDLAVVARLYFETVQRINARDYSPSQIAAWAPEPWPAAFWRRRFEQFRVFIAECRGQLAGFAELNPDAGHVDCFYVHHEWQRRSVGRAMMQAIERAMQNYPRPNLTADVSLTARPFFEAMGFSVLEERDVPYRGEVIRQFKMRRVLHGD